MDLKERATFFDRIATGKSVRETWSPEEARPYRSSILTSLSMHDV